MRGDWMSDAHRDFFFTRFGVLCYNAFRVKLCLSVARGARLRRALGHRSMKQTGGENVC